MEGSGRPVILVGFSGSGASLAALAWAASEARRRGARLWVVQAWQAHPARAPYAGFGGAEHEPPAKPATTERLAASVRAVIGDPADVDVVPELAEGAAERVLAAGSSRADLLVLGSGHQSPVAQADPLIVDRPVGPVIRACLSHARCPVVIVGPALAVPASPGSRDPARCHVLSCPA